MNDLYGCCTSIIHKYTNVVCRVFSSQDQGMLSMCIHTPIRERVCITWLWRDLKINSWELPNICGATNGTYIPLSQHTSNHLTAIATNFFNVKKLVLWYCVVGSLQHRENLLKCLCNATRWDPQCKVILMVFFVPRFASKANFSRSCYFG